MTTLVWFRNDLRVRDHHALARAQNQGNVVAVYIHESAAKPLGRASQWWLHHSLHAHAQELAGLGIPFLVEHGDPLAIIPALASRLGVDAVMWQRRYDAPGIEVDTQLTKMLPDANIHPTSHPGTLLVEPSEVSTSTGEPYCDHSPFAAAAKQVIDNLDPITAAPVQRQKQTGLTLLDPSDSIDSLELLPQHRNEPDWSTGLADEWTPGERGAYDRLFDFLDDRELGTDYTEDSDFPARHATSRLSPHLRFGEISPRRVWNACEDSSFRNALLWREFVWHLFHHLPIEDPKADHSEFDDAAIADSLRVWQTGSTGVPLVDAGMRELRETGYMHHRVRIAVGEFLTKNLGVHWRHGEQWFWDHLVDADPASNAINWQRIANSSDDASPFALAVNPEIQAMTFDPNETYINRWSLETSRRCPTHQSSEE